MPDIAIDVVSHGNYSSMCLSLYVIMCVCACVVCARACVDTCTCARVRMWTVIDAGVRVRRVVADFEAPGGGSFQGQSRKTIFPRSQKRRRYCTSTILCTIVLLKFKDGHRAIWRQINKLLTSNYPVEGVFIMHTDSL